MIIEKAAVLGACPGVKRALAIAEQAAREKGAVHTLGPLVHNRQTVSYLARLGVASVENIGQLADTPVIIPAHGASPQIWDDLRKRQLDIIDATCPIVRDAQQKAQELARDGFQVIIFGHRDHPEVRGLIGWADQDAQAATDPGVITLQRNRLGILSQTTQSQSSFAEFVHILSKNMLSQLKELRVFNTICDATTKRQEAAVELARRVDVILVVGSQDSANTRRLAETCRATGVTTYYIETVQDLKPEYWENQPRIGITAGASTPDHVIDDIVRELERN